MADEQKPPVAIRITRPYTTEAEFLEREFDTITHTSVVLVGAQARPQGVVLRFEIVLKGGESVLRGEGRVVGYKEKAHAGEPGLTLRFTRLDSRSKTLVDRAAGLREARARGSASVIPAAPAAPKTATPAPKPVVETAPESRPAPTPPPVEAKRTSESVAPPAPESQRPRQRTGPPPLPDYVRANATPIPPPPASPAMDIEVTQVDANFDRAPAPAPPPLPEPAVRAARPARPPAKPRAAPKPAPPVAAKQAAAAKRGAPIDRPGDRDALLTRLRTRAEGLPAARVQEILTKRAR